MSNNRSNSSRGFWSYYHKGLRVSPFLLVLSLAVMFMLGSGGDARANLLFYDNFETDRGIDKRVWQDDLGVYSARTIEMGGRTGKAAFRSIVGEAFSNNEARKTVATLRGKNVMAGITNSIPIRKNRWFGFSVLVPADFRKDLTDDIIFKLQSTGVMQEYAPNLSIAVTPSGEFVAYIKALNVANSARKGYRIEKTYRLGKAKAGYWHDFVVHTKLSAGRDGVIEIWRNNKPLVKYRGPNMMVRYDSRGNATPYGMRTYAALGVQKKAWEDKKERERSLKKRGVDRRVYYFDDYRVGGHYASYEDVVPGLTAKDTVRRIMTYLDSWKANNERLKRRQEEREWRYRNIRDTIGIDVANKMWRNGLFHTFSNHVSNELRSPSPVYKGNFRSYDDVLMEFALANPERSKKYLAKKANTYKVAAAREQYNRQKAADAKKVNSDGSPNITSIWLDLANPKVKYVKRGSKVTFKWQAKGVKDCRSSSTDKLWYGYVKSEGEFTVDGIQPNMRFHLACGWGKGERHRFLQFTDNIKWAKKYYGTADTKFVLVK